MASKRCLIIMSGSARSTSPADDANTGRCFTCRSWSSATAPTPTCMSWRRGSRAQGAELQWPASSRWCV